MTNEHSFYFKYTNVNLHSGSWRRNVEQKCADYSETLYIIVMSYLHKNHIFDRTRSYFNIWKVKKNLFKNLEKITISIILVVLEPVEIGSSSVVS